MEDFLNFIMGHNYQPVHLQQKHWWPPWWILMRKRLWVLLVHLRLWPWQQTPPYNARVVAINQSFSTKIGMIKSYNRYFYKAVWIYLQSHFSLTVQTYFCLNGVLFQHKLLETQYKCCIFDMKRAFRQFPMLNLTNSHDVFAFNLRPRFRFGFAEGCGESECFIYLKVKLEKTGFLLNEKITIIWKKFSFNLYRWTMQGINRHQQGNICFRYLISA